MDEILDVTEDTEKEIKKSLGPGPQEEMLSSAFNLKLTQGDIQTLENGQWLNDEVIDFYMNVLGERNEYKGYPAFWCLALSFTLNWSMVVTILLRDGLREWISLRKSLF